LRQAGGTNNHDEILQLETAEQLWSIEQPYARDSIVAMMEKISSKS
jgi:enoyl-CoA hydratase